ncbi:hypothetical protein K501DRAFT_25618 [Backusella circina FSU 941]|nr:hypothetical protein K501DRAFT_25618 [Backusella circina FSU 941]
MIVSDAVCLQDSPFYFMNELLLAALLMKQIQNISLPHILLSSYVGQSYPTHAPGTRFSDWVESRLKRTFRIHQVGKCRPPIFFFFFLPK